MLRVHLAPRPIVVALVLALVACSSSEADDAASGGTAPLLKDAG